MIRFLSHGEIDYEKWDACISKSFNSLPYAYSWYLDIVHPSWDALVEDDYERLMPLTASKKYGIRYLHQPFFVQQLGVFSTGILNAEIVDGFINQIPKNYKYADIRLNSLNQVTSQRVQVNSNKNHILDLINKYDKLAAAYNTNTKRNLKKGVKAELSLMKNIRPEEIISLFRANRGTQIQKWDDAHYQVLQRLMYATIHKGRGLSYGVYSANNQLCAAAFFVRTHDRLVFLFSGSDQASKEQSALTFLIDGVVREFANRQMVLDFEGSNDENLARYYKGFGAREVSYPGLTFNRLGVLFKALYSFYKKKNPLKYQ